MAKVKEELMFDEGKKDETKKIEREDLTLQRFMDDMQLIGKQLRGIKKPTFNFADTGITNYLLWLNLAEQMIANDLKREELKNWQSK